MTSHLMPLVERRGGICVNRNGKPTARLQFPILFSPTTVQRNLLRRSGSRSRRRIDSPQAGWPQAAGKREQREYSSVWKSIPALSPNGSAPSTYPVLISVSPGWTVYETNDARSNRVRFSIRLPHGGPRRRFPSQNGTVIPCGKSSAGRTRTGRRSGLRQHRRSRPADSKGRRRTHEVRNLHLRVPELDAWGFDHPLLTGWMLRLRHRLPSVHLVRNSLSLPVRRCRRLIR